jgi:hypothetical protein
MVKRIMICLLLTGFLLTDAGAQQQGKISRIGLLISASSAATAPFTDAFEQGLRELGYVEGKNIAIERRFADGKLNSLPPLRPNWWLSKLTLSLQPDRTLRSWLQSKQPARSQFS